jgi:hypothetical protein
MLKSINDELYACHSELRVLQSNAAAKSTQQYTDIQLMIYQVLSKLDRTQLSKVYNNSIIIENQVLGGTELLADGLIVDELIFDIINNLRMAVQTEQGNIQPSVYKGRSIENSGYAWVHLWVIAITFRNPHNAISMLNNERDAKLLKNKELIRLFDLSTVLKNMLDGGMLDPPA